MHNRIVNKTRYDDLGKLNETIHSKKPGGKSSRKVIHYSKKKFQI